MAESRRKRGGKSQHSESPKVLAEVVGPLFLAAEHLPVLGLSADTAAQTLADAQLAFGWIKSEARWYTQAELVAQANASWDAHDPIDRLNAAMNFLERTGVIVRVG